MNTKEITRKLKHKYFVGVFPSDKLPIIKDNKKICGLIANTDASSKPGTHWVAIIINANKTGEYFDPFGLPPLNQSFVDFLELNCPAGWCYSTRILQHPLSIKCGQYCIAFVRWRLQGRGYEQFLCAFSDNTLENELSIGAI